MENNIPRMDELPKETQAIFKTLKSTALFSELSAKQLISLASHCRLKQVKKGTTIYRKGDLANHLYVIQSGYIIESVYYGSSVDVIVKVRSDGEYFGEIGLLSSGPYPNTVIALEDCCLIDLAKSYFMEAVDENTSVCKVIILELIDRLLNSAQNMVNSMYLDAPGRLASTIVNLTTNSRQKIMTIRITQSALAFSSGMARQTAAKILSEWRKEKIIATERGHLKVLDFNKLLDIILDSEINSF